MSTIQKQFDDIVNATTGKRWELTTAPSEEGAPPVYMVVAVDEKDPNVGDPVFVGHVSGLTDAEAQANAVLIKAVKNTWPTVLVQLDKQTNIINAAIDLIASADILVTDKHEQQVNALLAALQAGGYQTEALMHPSAQEYLQQTTG
jgi:hypothetical protein